MMSVHEEIFVPLSELVLDPKAPLTLLSAGQQNGPTSAFGDFDRVSVLAGEVADRTRTQSGITVRAAIDVAAPQDARDVPPWVVVHVPLVI